MFLLAKARPSVGAVEPVEPLSGSPENIVAGWLMFEKTQVGVYFPCPVYVCFKRVCGGLKPQLEGWPPHVSYLAPLSRLPAISCLILACDRTTSPPWCVGNVSVPTVKMLCW